MGTDRDSYIQAGIQNAWMVTYTGGEIVTEFNRQGYIRQLKSIDWDRVCEFSAYNISDKGEFPTPIVTFPISLEDSPVWFHRSTGHIGERGRLVEEPIIDFIGIENAKFKNYCSIESSSVKIFFELKE